MASGYIRYRDPGVANPYARPTERPHPSNQPQGYPRVGNQYVRQGGNQVFQNVGSAMRAPVNFNRKPGTPENVIPPRTFVNGHDVLNAGGFPQQTRADWAQYRHGTPGLRTQGLGPRPPATPRPENITRAVPGSDNNRGVRSGLSGLLRKAANAIKEAYDESKYGHLVLRDGNGRILYPEDRKNLLPSQLKAARRAAILERQELEYTYGY